MNQASPSRGSFPFPKLSRRRLAAVFFSALAAFLICGPSPVPAADEPAASFRLQDAKAKGVTPSGDAKGTITSTYEESLRKDVWDFTYTLATGSSISVWAKDFPPEVAVSPVTSVKAVISVPEAAQSRAVTVKMEILGTKGVQSLPVSLKQGINHVQGTIDREKIGTLSGIAFVVAPAGEAPSRGTLYIAADLVRTAAAAPATKARAEAQRMAAAASQAAAKVSAAMKETARKVGSAAVAFVQEMKKYGTTTTGGAKGSATLTFDGEIRKDILDTGYTLVPGSEMRVWTKKFPPASELEQTNTVTLSYQVLEADQLNKITVRAEIKGSVGTKTVPLGLKPGWNIVRKPVRWTDIGSLAEVVFVITPKGDAPASGTLFLSADFSRITFMQRYLFPVKIGAAILGGLFLALLAFLAGKRTVKKPAVAALPEAARVSLISRLLTDLFYGVIVAAIAGVALWIYILGLKGPAEAGFWFLLVGLAGALIAECLKVKHIGRHLTPAEAFQDFFIAALLAFSSSRLELLQIPTVWSNLLMVNKLTAAVAFLVYQIFNANAMGSSGKHAAPVPAALIVGTPYLVGLLLLLENATLIKTMAYSLTFGLLAAWPAVLDGLGRLVVVFVFNELLSNGMSYATKGRFLKTPRAHGLLLLVSLAVVLAPAIANLGSAAVIGTWPMALRALVSVVTTVLSFAGLWGEVYLVTGILLDGGKHIAPSEDTIFRNVTTGMKKGMAYSGILMTILYVLATIFMMPAAQKVMASFPYVIGILLGAIVFPFAKTIIESFDGSMPFFDRLAYSYRNRVLYARGAVAGFGIAAMIVQGYIHRSTSDRILFGLMIGFLASGGISFFRDLVYMMKGCGKVQSWRLYFIDSLLGGFLGGMLAFYMDAQQVAVVIYKFNLYITSHFTTAQIASYPSFDATGRMTPTMYPYFSSEGRYVQPVLISKWGQVDLGFCRGGVKLLFTESLDGVIKWSVATWLFAINKVFMQAFFDKDKTPIKFFFSKAGLAQLTELMIYVLRWGLWMSPIIYTFLRMMPVATWYNQDGLIRTCIATWNSFTMSAPAFQEWSLKIFVWILAFDFFRILIWMDHMGLRVATLVNLSFLGMDKLDEKVARFIGPAAAQRYIPEGVKRFTTWAPLLIPFYLPRGAQWDEVWGTAEKIQNAHRGKGLIPALQSMSWPQLVLLIAAAVVLFSVVSMIVRKLHRRAARRKIASYTVANREYRITMKENTEVYGEVINKECDVTRRSYDLVDPCGRVLYLVDTGRAPDSAERAWPVAGNFPERYFAPSKAEKVDDTLRITNSNQGVRTSIDITLPDQDSTAEIWSITVENLTDRERQLKVVPYLEWVLNGWMHDRFHTQYQRLYPEMQYVNASNAMLSWNKSTKSMGFLASDIAPEGFLTGRVDFIGRARSIWSPRIVETLDFLEAKDTPACPTFDPIGSFLIHLPLAAGAKKTVKLMIGYAKKKEQALEMIAKHLKPDPKKIPSAFQPKKHALLIGHGEIPEGTPQPYYEFKNDGDRLLVKTPYTPRPFDHGMANPVHSVMVTNRGLHTSCNGNSQQNRVTPDWPDTVTREIPSEAIYLYEPDRGEWYSPTHHPLNDTAAKNECEFGVDGTAVFRMSKGNLSTELTVFVPTEDPMGVYLLTVRNHEDQARKIRVAPYFQMALAFQPERSGPLVTKYDKALDALFFENPRNTFRTGSAFVSMSIPADNVTTKRGCFFGSGRGPVDPYFVERAEPDVLQMTDNAQVAAFVGTLEVPARGERTVAIILGQTDHRKHAIQLVQKYKNMEMVKTTLDETRKWWLGLMGTTTLQTNQPEFDRYLNWLKYQALAERIWARRGFYQTSGAFGFRDQLQDTVNLTWVDPALARKQIILHASQQFIEGDVFHWFFTLTDGRSAFSCRSHASDNLLWIAWGVGEYIRITGDDTILDEMTSYVTSEFPFAPLPKNKHGWGALYGRSTRADTVYRHCMRSIDTVLDHRMGRNGLPLMGVGDWNDGLDEIGSGGKGESVWLGFFLYYILREMLPAIERKDGVKRKEHYTAKMKDLATALEKTWRGDRYLRAIHDDGTEIGVKDSGVWEIDALTAAWSVYTGINFDRGVTIFNTALSVLERGSVILLGWPALREDTKPYLGRSSKYPEGVRENGMYCHGVQWLVRAARLIAEEYEKRGDRAKADEYRATSFRLWSKISPLAHVTPEEIEIYGGQPNKQPADFLTTFEPGRMIW
ncbi:MAG TPA: hypothetical protein PK997_04470, partial [Candidatus Omnitrophota bacterium]|nr:hypothetical protein [Candidatus Omnitrophota bacterium]